VVNERGDTVRRDRLFHVEFADGVAQIHGGILPRCDYGGMRWIAMAALCGLPAFAAELKPVTAQAFDQYVRQTEDRLSGAKVFLWADENADRARRVRAIRVLIGP